MKRTVMALMVILVMALGNVCFAEDEPIFSNKRGDLYILSAKEMTDAPYIIQAKLKFVYKIDYENLDYYIQFIKINRQTRATNWGAVEYYNKSTGYDSTVGGSSEWKEYGRAAFGKKNDITTDKVIEYVDNNKE